MFLSRSVYSGNGSTSVFAVTFPYLSQSHVQVSVNGIPLAQGAGYAWINSSTISITSAPSVGSNNVDIRRVTPNGSLNVTYSDGSTLTESDLNAENLQLLYISQEAADDNGSRLGVVNPGSVTLGDWDALYKRLTNVAAPVSGGDAANMSWVQGLIAGTVSNGVGAPVVTSVAAVRATSSSKVTSLLVTGYYASGDGGGGLYQYDPNDTVSVDNGGTIIVAADGARWKLILWGPSFPEMFGAKGDGVTDDTDALQRWLSSLTAGDTAVLTSGKTYGFTNLTLPQVIPYAGPAPDQYRTFGYTIDGQGSVLKKLSAGADPTYGIASRHWIFNSIASSAAPIYLKNLNIDANGFCTLAALVTSGWNSLFENVNVFSAAGHGHLQDSLTANGTQIPFTQVNNRWQGCNWYLNGGHGLYQRVPTGTHGTDGVLRGCFGFDNHLSNVRVDNCGGWDFDQLHTYNNNVPSADVSLASFGRTGDTHFRGCQFDLDSTNVNKPVASVDGGSASPAGTFDACYFYGNMSIANPNGSFGVRYIFNGCDMPSKSGNDAYIYLASPRALAYSYGSHFTSTQPFRSCESNVRTYAYSVGDYCSTNGTRYHGQHTLTQGAAAPYVGGYAYDPSSPPANNPVPDGSTYTMDFGSPQLNVFGQAVNTGITVFLPSKTLLSQYQPTYRFIRRSTATGTGSISIRDPDTGNEVVAITAASVARELMFTGFAWLLVGNTGV